MKTKMSSLFLITLLMVSCGKTNPTGSGEGSALFGQVEGTLIQAADVKADGQPHLKLVAKSLSDEGTPFEMEIKGMINLDTPWLSPLKTEEYSSRAVG